MITGSIRLKAIPQRASGSWRILCYINQLTYLLWRWSC